MCVCVCVCVCVCARARSPTTGAGGGDANHDATLNVALKHGHVIARVASHKALVRQHAKESLPHVRQRQALAGGGGHYIHKKAAVSARDVAVASACDSRLAWCVRSSCQTTPCVAGARCLFFSLPLLSCARTHHACHTPTRQSRYALFPRVSARTAPAGRAVAISPPSRAGAAEGMHRSSLACEGHGRYVDADGLGCAVERA